MAEDDASLPPTLSHPLYNITFAPFRVSPLFIGAKPLDRTRLVQLSASLRDLLVGDVVRGVHVGLGTESDGMGNVGSLEAIEWKCMSLKALMGRSRDPLSPLDNELERESCLRLSIRFQAAHCTAIFLPGPNHQRQTDIGTTAGVLHLPLLLVRAPASIRPIILDFCRQSFDCRISDMRLGADIIVHTLETWLSSLGPLSASNPGKDVVLTLGFLSAEPQGREEEHLVRDGSANPALRTIDVAISAMDIAGFAAQGNSLATEPIRQTPARGVAGGRAPPAGRRAWAGTPFTRALALYLEHHIALDIFHPGVAVIKIACAGFVLSENRVKIFAGAMTGAHGEGEEPVLGVLMDRAVLSPG